MSGVFLVTVSTWLYSNGMAGFAQILPLAVAGAALGDHAGFFVGRWSGPRLHRINFVQSRSDLLQRAEHLISRYGALAVFIGRLIPAIRSLVPAMLGISDFRTVYFSMLDIAACLLWSLGLGAIIIGVDNLI